METAVLDNAFIGKNVRRARNAREMDLKGLSAELTELGHPMGVSALSKLENGDRKVLAEDLPYLAAALGVTPNVLLLGDGTREDGPTLRDPIRVAGKWEIPLAKAWEWVQGERLPETPRNGLKRSLADFRRERAFCHRSKPHDPPVDLTFDEFQQLEAAGVFEGLHATLRELEARDLGVDVARQGIEASRALETLEEDVRDIMGGADESPAS